MRACWWRASPCARADSHAAAAFGLRLVRFQRHAAREPAIRRLTAHVLPLLTAWCSTLADGGPEAINAAEAVFAADSAFAALCLTRTRSRDDRLVVAAVSAADIARTVTARPHRALRGHRLAASERRTRDALRLRPRSAAADPVSLIPRPLTEVWAARHKALAAYQIALAEPHISALCASDLVHMVRRRS
ncbi:lantibiotic dehydratase C-terminal domain-containing protein [Streptomyces sp. 6N223]|uniref:lantibiotic dehydratase C-terminal domain-containing protein n=1 Tax=Streptomyces sp. 6N223 TaxID=3457412 RepID=UPI003FD49013